MKIWGIRRSFLVKQFRFVVMCTILAGGGYAMSKNEEKRMSKNEIFENSIEVKTREILQSIKGNLQNAKPKTVRITQEYDNPPMTCIQFQTFDGHYISYYEDNGSLYMNRNGKREKVLEDLVSAFFQLPKHGSNRAFIELCVWKSELDSDNLGIDTISGYTEFGIQESRKHRKDSPRLMVSNVR